MKTIFQFFATLCMLVGLAGTVSASSVALDAAPQVNINQASAEELAEALTGVGDSRARAIVDSRESSGPFDTVESLKRVKGVGEATIEENRARIRLK